MLIDLAKDEKNQPEYVLHLSETEMLYVRDLIKNGLPVIIGELKKNLADRIKENNLHMSFSLRTHVDLLTEMNRKISYTFH
jgi:hypothetical protein